MTNIIKRLLNRKTKKQDMLEAIRIAQSISDAHLIALCRLTFIKPSTLVREAQNVKANAEYLLQMVNEQEKLNDALKDAYQRDKEGHYER